MCRSRHQSGRTLYTLTCLLLIPVICRLLGAAAGPFVEERAHPEDGDHEEDHRSHPPVEGPRLLCLGLRAPFSSDALRSASNRNTHASRSAPSSVLEKRLDDFFAPFNAQLYEWLRAKGMDAHFGRWEEEDPLAPRAKV